MNKKSDVQFYLHIFMLLVMFDHFVDIIFCVFYFRKIGQNYLKYQKELLNLKSSYLLCLDSTFLKVDFFFFGENMSVMIEELMGRVLRRVFICLLTFLIFLGNVRISRLILGGFRTSDKIWHPH